MSVTKQDAQFSTLRRLVEDVIVSFPDDSHRRIEYFFNQRRQKQPDDERNESIADNNNNNSETDSDALERVRRAWARAMVKSKAFTKRNEDLEITGRESEKLRREKEKAKVRIANPVEFTDDLISDLSLGDGDLASIISNSNRVVSSIEKMCGAYQSNGTTSTSSQIQKGHEPIRGDILNSSLASILRVGSDLKDVESRLYDTSVFLSNPLFNSSTVSEAIMEYRTWARKLRMRWESSGSNRRWTGPQLFCPINLTSFKAIDTVVLGSLTEGDGHSPWAIDVNQVIGVRVLSKSSTLQSRVWSTYTSITSFCCARRYNPFGVVLKVEQDNHNSSMACLTLVFEYPSCKPIRSVLGPLLATFLHRSPAVLQLWCAQLVIAQQLLLALPAANRKLFLTAKPSINSTFIRNDGRLVIGGLAFDELQREAIQAAQESQRITSYIRQVLAECFCISRSAVIMWGVRNTQTGDSFGPLRTTAGRGVPIEEIFYITEGSILDLTILDFDRPFQLSEIQFNQLTQDEKAFTSRTTDRQSTLPDKSGPSRRTLRASKAPGIADKGLEAPGETTDATEQSQKSANQYTVSGPVAHIDVFSVNIQRGSNDASDTDWTVYNAIQTCPQDLHTRVKVCITAYAPGQVWVEVPGSRGLGAVNDVAEEPEDWDDADNSSLRNPRHDLAARRFLVVVLKKPVSSNVEVIELCTLLEESHRSMSTQAGNEVYLQARLLQAPSLMQLVDDNVALSNAQQNWSAFVAASSS